MFRRRIVRAPAELLGDRAGTNAHSAKHNPDAHTRMPSAASAPPVTTAATSATELIARGCVTVDFRHASSGPTPVRNSRIRPIGAIHLLKNGPATVSRLPVTASLSVGNIVANSTKNAENSRIQLLTRNAASRDSHESSSLRALQQRQPPDDQAEAERPG